MNYKLCKDEKDCSNVECAHFDAKLTLCSDLCSYAKCVIEQGKEQADRIFSSKTFVSPITYEQQAFEKVKEIVQEWKDGKKDATDAMIFITTIILPFSKPSEVDRVRFTLVT